MTPLRCFRLLFALLLPGVAFAQPAPEVIPLWPRGAPGFESRRDEPEQAKDWWVRHVNNPSLTVFRPAPEKANGCAIVVAPGGGFRELVFNNEGRQAAEFLNSLGVTVFVLKYRLPKAAGSPYTMNHVRQDAFRAVRLVRRRADEFRIDPHRLGMLGFSAGGVVAMMVGYSPGAGDPAAADPVDRADGRPNFLMMVYPGWEALPKRVPHDSPPAFLLCANDDDYHCDRTMFTLLQEYRDAGVPVEAHFIVRGKHAFNMGDRSPYLAIRHWPERLADWLSDSGYLRPAGAEAGESAGR